MRGGPAGVDRIPAVDRNRAGGDIGKGLLVAAVALGVFALTFVAAIIYIG